MIDSPRVACSTRRDRALTALAELGRDLASTQGFFEATDLLLSRLMGELDTAHSALWLLPEQGSDDEFLLVRSRGFESRVLKPLGQACGASVIRACRAEKKPLTTWELKEHVGVPEFLLVHQTGVRIVGALCADGQTIGWVALGPQTSGSVYSIDDVEVLEAALAMEALSLSNTMLHNRALEAQRQLRRRDEQLEELDRLKGSLLDNVNHELRTPVAVVVATLECLRDQLTEDAHADLLNGALDKAVELRRVVEDLLTYSQTTRDASPVELSDCDLGALGELFFRDRLPGLTAQLREFVYVQDSNLPTGVVHRPTLIRILDELLENAVKFTPAGTRIWLKVSNPSNEDPEHVRIQLQDEGAGIPREHVSRVFNPFEQADGSSTRSVGGLGVGLALARHLADRMNCTMRASSCEGEGSVFEVLVPLAGHGSADPT